jgi:hypothetical protein
MRDSQRPVWCNHIDEKKAWHLVQNCNNLLGLLFSRLPNRSNPHTVSLNADGLVVRLDYNLRLLIFADAKHKVAIARFCFSCDLRRSIDDQYICGANPIRDSMENERNQSSQCSNARRVKHRVIDDRFLYFFLVYT